MKKFLLLIICVPVVLSAQSGNGVTVENRSTVVDCINKADAPGASGISFSEFCPLPTAPDASTWTLTDPRDGKAYKVKKLADGRYWMVQDLKFGNCTDNSFKNDNSAGAATTAPTVATGYVGHCRNNTQADAGHLYNWPAAMNNAKAYYFSEDAGFHCVGIGPGTAKPNPGYCKGICPEGWHLPTRDEFADANTQFQSKYACSGDGCWNASSRWEGVSGGGCDGSGSLGEQGLYAYYWSSTNNNTASAYSPTFNSGYLDFTDIGNKAYGFSVRCVRNY